MEKEPKIMFQLSGTDERWCNVQDVINWLYFHDKKDVAMLLSKKMEDVFESLQAGRRANERTLREKLEQGKSEWTATIETSKIEKPKSFLSRIFK